jgi:hypothetical protein
MLAWFSCDAGMTFVHDTGRVLGHACAQVVDGMAMSSITWNGTRIEQLELVAAVERHCECTFDKRGMRLGACPAHTMLIRDQRALDGLLWTRHLVKQRLAEEGISAP